MQLEITLIAPSDQHYSARDLGYLLHKHPDHTFERSTGHGTAMVFYPEVSDERTTAVLHVEVDPIDLVRGKNHHSDGLLSQYVNDRPYVGSSFLSVALARVFAQSLAGKSKERQALADEALAFELRVAPLAVAGSDEFVRQLFEPLGYEVELSRMDPQGFTTDLTLIATLKLSQILSHLYVLVPVLDNFKHYYVAHEEIDKLLEKGEGWLSEHPCKELIARRSLRNQRTLANAALARLGHNDSQVSGGITDNISSDLNVEVPEKKAQEAALEKPLRLHDLRLDTVVGLLRQHSVKSVLDLGCGEGKLLARLLKERGIDRIVGVDPSIRTLEFAHQRLHLDTAGEAMRARLQLMMGSLTYGDRRWVGFDAATLVEVIEHIEPARLSALELSLFGVAKPTLIIISRSDRTHRACLHRIVNITHYSRP